MADLSIEPCAIVQAESWPGTSAAFEAELSRLLSGALPAVFGEVVAVGIWQAIRIAPRRFWFVADAASDLSFMIDPALGCLLPLKESRVRLKLSGPHMLDILSACVAIDWNAEQTQPGRAIQTGFHNVPIMAIRRAADACDLLIPRSFAQSLAEWVAEVAAPYRTRESHAVTA